MTIRRVNSAHQLVPLVANNGVITPNADQGTLFRHVATGNVALATPTNGDNAQVLEVQVYASGATRTLTVAGAAITILEGSWWWGRFSYDSASAQWILDDGTGNPGGGGSGSSGTLFANVRDYGAVGDGTADDTAAIASAIAGVTYGGTVFLPPGAYRITAPIVITRQIKLLGCGGGSSDHCQTAPSRIVSAATTGDALTVSVHGVILEDFAVVNTATTPTAGAGIHFTLARYSRLNRVGIFGFYDNLTFDQGIYYQITDCHIMDPMRYGIWIRNTDVGGFDTGDQLISGCTIAVAGTTRDPTSAIRWESGGGPRIIGCKVNGSNTFAGEFAYGIDAAVADGGTTVDMVISGCSIENVTTAGIAIRQAGTTGSFSRVMITGNEIGSGNIPDGIQVISATLGLVGDVTITGNVITTLNQYGIRLDRASRVAISGNVIRGSLSQAFIYANGCDGIAIGHNILQGSASVAAVLFGSTYSTSCTLQPQNTMLSGGNIPLVQNNGENSVAHASLGEIVYEDSRELPNITTSASYAKLYRFQPSSTGMGGVLDFSITGLAAGGNSFVITGRRAVILSSAGGATPTVTTIGTDVTAGTAVDYQIDVATAGELAVSAKLNAASGATNVSGRCTVRYLGSLARFIRV